jgi:hypothetical protein
MNRTEYDFVSSIFDGITNMSEQSDNDRANNSAAITELSLAAHCIERMMVSKDALDLEKTSVESHEKAMAALKEVVVDIDEEIAERRDD